MTAAAPSPPGGDLRILVTAEDVTPDIEGLIPDVVDWYEEAPMPTDEFIDRLCEYADGWDIEQLDTPAVRKIMRLARAEKNGRAL